MQIPQLQKLEDKTSLNFKIKEALQKAVREIFNYEISESEIEVTKTQDEKFGDLTTNIALKLSKQISKNPREVAEIISKSELQINEFIDKTEIAGPGFINFYISQKYLVENLKNVLHQEDKFGRWNLENKLAMVEFGHPNTHKAIQVSHLKSLTTGLSFVRIIENLGFKVIQANFFGDIGMHVAKCIWGFIQKGQPEGFDQLDPHEKMRYLNDCYAYGSSHFKESAEAKSEITEINNKIYRKSDPEIVELYNKTRQWSAEHQALVFEKVGVKYDRQYPESEVLEEGIKIVKENIGKVFIEDQNAVILSGKEYGVTTFVFISSDGNPTYPGKDLGLASIKFKEYPELYFNITPTAAEQNEHFKTVIKALELINEKYTGKYFHIGFGHLLNNNKKSSSRSGGAPKAIDILTESKQYSLNKIQEFKKYDESEADFIAEKVALAGIKFVILAHEVTKDVNFDLEQYLNPEGFSGPYVLYSYVRAKSILRQESQLDNSIIEEFDNINAEELVLLKLINHYPQVTLQAGKTLSPHLIAFYLFELAQAFNKFYKENKVLVEDENIKNFRLNLVQGVSIVLKNGLNLLGIETIEQM